MYTPHRDYRFEYIHDAIGFVEEHQCVTCIFKKKESEDGQHALDYPMCYEIEGEFITEEPMAVIADKDDAGIECLKYERQL